MKLAHVLDGPRDAPVLVLSSSLGTTTALWDAQVPVLSEPFRVLRYDHPGHGDSAVVPGPLTVSQLARGVLDLLDELELERVSFCGLSLGGMVGMSLALQAPERLDRLVLCCTAAYLGPSDGWVERARIVRGAGTAAIADAVLERWFTQRFRDLEPGAVARFRDQFTGIPNEGYAACCEAVGSWDTRGEIHAIAVPTLVLGGAEDPVVDPDAAAVLAGAIRGASLVVLPDAAHLANVEQPALFSAALLEHLAHAVAA